MSHFAGLVAGKVHPEVVPHCHVVSTTTHKTLRGPRGGMLLSSHQGGELMLAGMAKPKTVVDALDSWVFPGIQGGPLEHVIAAKAVAFGEALTPEFRKYAEQVVKNAMPTDGTYSLKIASSVPFEAGVSRTIKVTPGAEVKVRVMYALYDHGGTHGGNVLTYDWAAMGVKVDDWDATWVNGPWHGQWLPLEQTVKAGKDGRIMIFLQVLSPLAENVNGYFDNVQVWVDGKPYTG
jgi:hypothetical protein